ncbi:hypothetical protein K502DRAFT_359987 [Neoconidiobolus thromboides FSU 785]|nr:hypothetical protein K502DRAFT_359987 [Neoconidiobolus thromboides FSU 785]
MIQNSLFKFMQLALLLLLLLKISDCSNTPGLAGANGGIINDTIYVFGGFSDSNSDPKSENEEIVERSFNTGVYYLDLKGGIDFNNEQGANWKFDSLGDHPLNTLFHYSTIRLNDSSEELLIMGGAFTPIEESVKIFNTKTKTWKVDQTGSQFIKHLNFGNLTSLSLKYGPVTSSLNQNDLNPDELVISGGAYTINKLDEDELNGDELDEDKLEVYPGLIIYNTKNNEWRSIEKTSEHSIDSLRSFIHNGNLITFESQNKLYYKTVNFNTIISFNIKDKKWHNQTTLGEFPEARTIYGLKKVKNLVYIIGGTSDENFKEFADSSLYVLNLDNLVWEKHYISGLISSVFSYLDYYNGYLLYCFGYRLEVYSKMQIISLNNYTLVHRLPSAKEIEDLKPKSQIPAIIGGSIGGFIGFVLLIVIIYFSYKKLKHYRIVKKVPLTIPEPTYNSTEFIIKNPTFTLEDDEAEFDETL